MNGGTNMYGTIYKITNTINGKVYIGQTKQPFHYRYPKGISSTTNEYLKRAINYYGEEAFRVEKCFDTADTQEELDEKEIYYISLYRSTDRKYGYNIMSGGLHSKHAEESKQKIGDAQRGCLNHNYGKRGKDSPKYKRISGVCDYCGKRIEISQCDIRRSKFHYCSTECKKASKIHLNKQERKRIQVSCSNCGAIFETFPSRIKNKKNIYCSRECQNEHYKTLFEGEKNPNYNNHKVSGGNNGRAKKVFCITTGEIFDCAIDAGKKYGIKRGLIPACCRGEQKTAGGKEWKYL